MAEDEHSLERHLSAGLAREARPVADSTARRQRREQRGRAEGGEEKPSRAEECGSFPALIRAS